MSLKDMVMRVKDPRVALEVIEQQMEAALLAGADDRQRPVFTFSPSGLHGLCPRYAYYALSGVVYSNPPAKTQPNTKLQRIFDMGSFIHASLQGWMAGSGKLIGNWRCTHCGGLFGDLDGVWSEWRKLRDLQYNAAVYQPNRMQELSDTLLDMMGPYPDKEKSCTNCGLRGHGYQYVEPILFDKDRRVYAKTDGILQLGKLAYVLEIKSINTHEFKKLTGPKPEHVTQALSYAWMPQLKKRYPGLQGAVLVYYDKNTSELCEFSIPMGETPPPHLDVVGDVMRAKAVGEVPARVCRASHEARAVDCPFSAVCFGLREPDFMGGFSACPV